MSLNLKKYEVVMIDKWNKFVKANKKDSWILFGFEGKTFDLIHCGSGDDGMEEFVEELSNGRIMYGAISVEDPNTSLQKIVFICWQGQSVPTNIRGKVASFGSAINQFFKGYSIEITATSEEDLSIDVIKEKVKSASGSNYSIHEKKAKGEAKTHEICSYQKVDPISEITNARNTQSQSQAAKFLEEPESDNKLNSAKTVREQRIKEMDEMIKMSRTTNLAKPDEESVRELKSLNIET
uniref:Drebrin-like protein A (Trinotate prediction) n=1 Tax=Myxobolus squamalis TaxID=59785 RepID=A0A6B2FZI3_MYXSQ